MHWKQGRNAAQMRKKDQNVIEKHALFEIAINLRTWLIVVRADRDDVFNNVSLVDVYGPINFQF